MPLINVRGVDLFYREAGAGTPLLLIHGAAGNADVWSSVFDPFSRAYRTIAYDRRAHTRSQGPPPPPAENYATHGDDAAALLRALDAAPATVIGWSGGGLTALHLASTHPELVRHLILEEPPLHVLANPTPDAGAIFEKMSQLAGEGRLRDAAETFLRFAGAYETGGTAFDRWEPELREAMLANAPTLLQELQAGTGEELAAEQLRRITCPVTCLVGELTPAVLVAGTDRLVGFLPAARLVRIAGAAHAIHMDQPQRFIDAIETAVARA